MKILLFFLFLISPLFAENSLWTRPVIIGASLSDGFHHSEIGHIFKKPKSDRLSLEKYFEKAILAPHGKITNFGSSALFLAVDASAKNQINRASKKMPTLIIAPDFLFWFVYGKPSMRGEGLEKLPFADFLERGLQYLDQFRCPIALGDIPDCRQLLGGILDKKQYERTDSIKKVNSRIKEWAAQKPNVTLIPIASFFETVSQNKKITLLGKTIKAGKTYKTLLQQDGLHPTERGSAAITLLLLETLHASKHLSKADVLWDMEEIIPN